jgi:hypothetical protein
MVSSLSHSMHHQYDYLHNLTILKNYHEFQNYFSSEIYTIDVFMVYCELWVSRQCSTEAMSYSTIESNKFLYFHNRKLINSWKLYVYDIIRKSVLMENSGHRPFSLRPLLTIAPFDSLRWISNIQFANAQNVVQCNEIPAKQVLHVRKHRITSNTTNGTHQSPLLYKYFYYSLQALERLYARYINL